MQFSLRLARWVGFKHELVLPETKLKVDVNAHAHMMRVSARRIGAYAAGEIMLADFAHKFDHAAEQETARQTRFTTLPRVSQALMLFALDSANEFDFRPRQAFTIRLANLRERFGIPELHK